MPLISVIVPVYNVEKYLKRCLESIQRQTIRDLEIILVDDGSTDNSGVICDEAAEKDKRIKVIHQDNRGLSGARNTGMLYATGEYVGFIDSDDWISGDYYEYLLNLILKYEADISSCSFRRVAAVNESKKKGKEKHILLSHGEARIWLLNSAVKSGYNDVSCCTKLYKHKILKDITFNEQLIHEDVIFNWFVFGKIDRYVKSFDKKYFYFTNQYSITNNNFSKKNMDLIKGANIICDSCNMESKNMRRITKKYLAKSHFSIVVKLLKSVNTEFELLENELKILRKFSGTLLMSSLSLSRKIFLVFIIMIPNKVWLYLKKEKVRSVGGIK